MYTDSTVFLFCICCCSRLLWSIPSRNKMTRNALSIHTHILSAIHGLQKIKQPISIGFCRLKRYPRNMVTIFRCDPKNLGLYSISGCMAACERVRVCDGKFNDSQFLPDAVLRLDNYLREAKRKSKTLCTQFRCLGFISMFSHVLYINQAHVLWFAHWFWRIFCVSCVNFTPLRCDDTCFFFFIIFIAVIVALFYSWRVWSVSLNLCEWLNGKFRFKIYTQICMFK